MELRCYLEGAINLSLPNGGWRPYEGW